MANKPDSPAVHFEPKNERQKTIARIWDHISIGIFIGCAGVGKTFAPMSLGLRDALRPNPRPLWITRPQIACDHEEMGFLKGSLEEKMMPWLGSFIDVLSDSTTLKLEKLIQKEVILPVPLGYLRGRTVKGTLIVDEAQNLTYAQLMCVLTRIGPEGRIILCGDPDQSDLEESPLEWMANKQEGGEGVAIIRFLPEDDCRNPRIKDIIRRGSGWKPKRR